MLVPALRVSRRFMLCISQSRRSASRLVLGIESTFDDSGAAVIDENGKVLGDSLISQVAEHVSMGGVRPDIAMKLHEKNIPIVIEEAMSKANVGFEDLSALATATRPGFSMSLRVGLTISKEIVKKHNLPFIPVHHMEAHALTARSFEKINFPFLVLLASGGHCILCLAQGLGDYKILGEALDEPPGAVFDKVARELKISDGDESRKMSGGEWIQSLAAEGKSSNMPFTVPLTKGINRHTKSCNFSFSGLQTQVQRRIFGLRDQDALDHQACKDLAAGFQDALVQHIVRQVHRGIIYCRRKNLLPDTFTLVISGGVASNTHFRKCLSELCRSLDVRLCFPPKHLCTDNGIMIAWCGMEYLLEGIGICKNIEEVDFEPRSPLGPYIGKYIIKQNIIMQPRSIMMTEHG